MTDVGFDRRQQFNDLFNTLMKGKATAQPNYATSSILQGISTKDLESAAKMLTKVKAPKKTVAQQAADAATKQAQMKDILSAGIKPDQPWYKDLLHGAVNVAEKGLDLVSRPAYALAEGTKRAIIAGEDKTANNPKGGGEHIWQTGDDFLKGLWGGFSGKNKTGWGQVYQAADTNPNKSDWMENKWFKRAVGLTGDIAGDPATWLSAGSVTALKKGSEEVGKEALLEGAKNSARETGQSAIKSAAESATKRALNESERPLKKEVVDKITQSVADHVDKIAYDVAGGAQKGKTIFNKAQDAKVLADHAAEGARTALIDEAQPQITRYMRSVDKISRPLREKELTAMRDKSELFKVWHDSYKEAAAVGEKVPKEIADQAMKKALEGEVRNLSAKISGELEKRVMRVPTLRALGKDIAYFPKLGEKLTGLADKAHSVESIQRASKVFSYTSNFPGYSSFIAQKVRSLGNHEYQGFRENALKFARGTTKEERIDLQHALQEGRHYLNPRMEQKRQFLQDQYNTIYDREIAHGVRDATKTPRIENYAYTHLKSSGEKFRSAKAEALKTQNTLAGFTTKDALKQGLRANQDAFENLLLRKVKSIRSETDHFFKTDLAQHYGFKGTLNKTEANARKLTEITGKDLPEDVLKTLKGGEKFYIDHDINTVYKNYKRLLETTDVDRNPLIRTIDYITRKFKAGNTLYFPAFHIRNFLSDAFMGALDGVDVKDYSTILKNWGKRDVADLNIAGHTFKFSEVEKWYEKNAASGGFFSTEISKASKRDLGGEGFKANLIHPTSYPASIRRFSEHREDFGRFVHFYHAMQEEYPAALKKFGNGEKSLNSAINASIFRVNKYKFDYGALTREEQKFMRRGVPFYTYMRKAIPTLMESVLLSPKYLSYTNRLFQELSPKSNGVFDSMLLPSYLRDSGFLGLGPEGDQPWGLSGSFLPQQSMKDLFQNPAAQLNPLIRAPFELHSGKATFNGKDTSDLGSLVLSNMRVADTIQTIKGDKISTPEKVANLLGIPIKQITHSRQNQTLNYLTGQLVNSLKELSGQAKDKGYNIYLSQRKNGASIRIADAKTHHVIGEYLSVKEAQAALGQL